MLYIAICWCLSSAFEILRSAIRKPEHHPPVSQPDLRSILSPIKTPSSCWITLKNLLRWQPDSRNKDLYVISDLWYPNKTVLFTFGIQTKNEPDSTKWSLVRAAAARSRSRRSRDFWVSKFSQCSLVLSTFPAVFSAKWFAIIAHAKEVSVCGRKPCVLDALGQVTQVTWRTRYNPNFWIARDFGLCGQISGCATSPYMYRSIWYI